MKKTVFLLAALLTMLCLPASAQTSLPTDTVYGVREISQDEFRQFIGDWATDGWAPARGRTVVVDFKAAWCIPCRRMAPELLNVAQHYDGKVDFYSVDIDANKALTRALQIRSVPTLLVCRLDGQRRFIIGFYPASELIQAIDQALK